MFTPRSEASERRSAAADRYKPDKVKLLLVAETPPTALDRYFYFEDVSEHDSLFRYVARVLLGRDVGRSDKAEALRELQAAGVFLIDLKPDPHDPTPLSGLASRLVERCKALAPERILLIKVTVYDAAFAPLQRAGLPVSAHRIPFPGSGQQKRFEAEFRAAVGATSTAPTPLSLDRPEKLAAGSASPRIGEKPTLHVELVRLLEERDGWMTTDELAARVNAEGRYRKGDGSSVTPFQVHGRTRTYPHLFERDGARVRLRRSEGT